MNTPFIQGSIDRTVLLTYRIEPAALEGMLPAHLRPYCIRGRAIGGVVLLRVAEMRPRFLPSWMGLQSQHAMHWLAVLRETASQAESQGLYIFRRDTDSRLGALAGGGLFRGDHHHASFAYRETPSEIEATMVSDDGAAQVGLLAGVSGRLPAESIFSDPAAALDLFNADANASDGLRFARRAGDCEALCARYLHASFFDDELRFPRGTVKFDSAVLARSLQRITAPAAPALADAHA